jgi:hypothetical protein
MKKLICTSLMLIITGLAFINCYSQPKDESISVKYTHVWSTPADLKTPESVLYDHTGQILFVSNVNGNPTDKDGNGFISKLSTDGNITTLNWVTGLNAPKGMGIFNNILFVTDIDKVIAINIEDGTIKKTYVVPQAKFLNDISISKEGVVYISDMNDNAIYAIQPSSDTIELWLKSEKLTSPNGLWTNKGELLVGLSDRVVAVNYSSKVISDFILNTGGIDGLVSAGNETYLISDWVGSTHLIEQGKPVTKIFNTSADKINAADIEFIVDKKLLLVPTFFDNRVVGYSLSF